MASIFFTFLPVVLTFAAASLAPVSKRGAAANLDGCAQC
jgi:hypothetical protein